jgi:hypothetical protein
MDIELKGIEELRDCVNRLGLFAKTMQMAADKMDEALSAHIAAMDNLASRLETIQFNENQRQDYANLSRQHGGHNGL